MIVDAKQGIKVNFSTRYFLLYISYRYLVFWPQVNQKIYPKNSSHTKKINIRMPRCNNMISTLRQLLRHSVSVLTDLL